MRKIAVFGYFKFLVQNVSGGTQTKRGKVRMLNVKAAVLIGVRYDMYWKYSKTCHMNFNETTFKQSFEYHGMNMYQLCRIFKAMMPNVHKVFICSYFTDPNLSCRSVSGLWNVLSNPSLISFLSWIWIDTAVTGPRLFLSCKKQKCYYWLNKLDKTFWARVYSMITWIHLS